VREAEGVGSLAALKTVGAELRAALQTVAPEKAAAE
jgi:hypothetical protein